MSLRLFFVGRAFLIKARARQAGEADYVSELPTASGTSSPFARIRMMFQYC